jgi:hypothetical protein
VLLLTCLNKLCLPDHTCLTMPCPTQVYGKSFHVLLTTYEYLMSKSDRPRLSRTPWQLLVVDEGHRLKNAECKLSRELKAYRTKSRLLLTGRYRGVGCCCQVCVWGRGVRVVLLT